MNLIKHTGNRYVLSGFLCLGLVVNTVQAADGMGAEAASGVPGTSAQAATQNNAATAESAKTGTVYALVNGTPIMVRNYNKELFVLMKNRFYHGKVPEGQEEAVRKELTDRMVDHVLLLQDAAQRGLKADQARIEKVVADSDAKYGSKPGWQEQRENLLAELRVLVAEQDMTDQLARIVRDVPQPIPAEIRDYYDQHLDLFTEPEKLRLSVILLKVDPSSPVDEWMAAYQEAQKISDQIKDGADFAEMARKYSNDKTARFGGDMGYLHRGMVPAAIQNEVDKFKVGEMSAPYKGLEGFSVFRLEDRIPARKMEFEQVVQRATDLLMRDRKDRAWKANLERLRSVAKIEILDQPGGKRESVSNDVKADEVKKEPASSNKKKPKAAKKKPGAGKKKPGGV